MISVDVLKIKEFRLLFMGQSISQLGDSLYFLIFMFMVQKLTNSSAMVGYVSALQSLPFLFFSLYAGVVADRVDRRKVLLFCDFSSAAILLLFGLYLLTNPTPPVALVFALACSLSVVNSFFLPAKQAAVPQLVPGDYVIKANSVSMAAQNLMPMIGLGISGTVLAQLYNLYPNWFFFSAVMLNAVSFLGSAAYLFPLPKLLPRESANDRRPWRDFVEGMKYVRKRPDLLVLILLALGLNLFIAPFFVSYLAANEQWFKGSFGTLAFLELGFVVGMVVGSLVVGGHKIRRPGVAFSASLFGVGLGVAALAFGKIFWLFLLINVLTGLILPYAQIPLVTYLQLSVPNEFRGRVNSTLMMAGMGVLPIGQAAAGPLLDRFGVVPMFVVMGLGLSAVALAGMLSPAFRKATMPEMPTQSVEVAGSPTTATEPVESTS